MRDIHEASLESFSDSSTDSNKLQILSKNNTENEIENENNINNTIFTSIKDNPFILNAVTCCSSDGADSSVICGFKKTIPNSIHYPQKQIIVSGSDSIKCNNRIDLESKHFSSASTNETIMLSDFSMTNNSKHQRIDDGLANIDVKQLVSSSKTFHKSTRLRVTTLHIP